MPNKTTRAPGRLLPTVLRTTQMNDLSRTFSAPDPYFQPGDRMPDGLMNRIYPTPARAKPVPVPYTDILFPRGTTSYGPRPGYKIADQGGDPGMQWI